MLCGNALALSACIFFPSGSAAVAFNTSASLNSTASSPVFITITTMLPPGVEKAVHSRLLLPVTLLSILTEPRGTYLLQAKMKTNMH